jgi:hypothetical protein
MQPLLTNLRYVVLRHDGIPDAHFDLMFETGPGSMLQTWRLSEWPVRSVESVTRIRDHRRAFLDFQGDLTGGRGTVIRIDEGTCGVEVANNRVTLELASPPGKIVLEREPGPTEEHWNIRSESSA